MTLLAITRKFAAMALLAMIMLAALPASQAQPLPEVSITVEDPGELATDPVEYTHVNIEGTVTVENYPLGAEVQINASTDTAPDWVISVTPSSFTIDQGLETRMVEYTIDLRVPPKTSVEGDKHLTVFANATGPVGFALDTDETIDLTVEQYYELRVDTNRTTSVEQGKNNTFRFRVTNTGNGPDNFTVALMNKASLKTSGLNISYDEAIYELGKDRAYAVRVEISASPEAKVTPEGESGSEALFNIVSEGDPAKSAKYTLTILIRKGEPANGNGGNGDDGEDSPGFGAATVAFSLVVVVAIAVLRRRRRS